MLYDAFGFIDMNVKDEDRKAFTFQEVVLEVVSEGEQFLENLKMTIRRLNIREAFAMGFLVGDADVETATIALANAETWVVNLLGAISLALTSPPPLRVPPLAPNPPSVFVIRGHLG